MKNFTSRGTPHPSKKKEMPHSFGKRARTRHMFAKKFGDHGLPSMSTYLRTYKVGDYVDIKANGAVHKGMPFKFYHGKTAVIYNVTKGALGLIVNKLVGNRYMEKKINVRIEHVVPSKCRQDFLQRVAANDAARKQAKAEGKALVVGLGKRLPKQPIAGHFVSVRGGQEAVSVAPVPYEALI